MNTFSIGDIRTYISKKNTIEIVRIFNIKDEVITVRRLDKSFADWEKQSIKLNTKSNWRSFITNDDKRSALRKFIDRLLGR